MKYFTPELYRLGNTPSSSIYDDFDLIWDQKIREYHKYLRTIKSQTPSEVFRLASKICLGGGEIVGTTRSSITVWLDEVLYLIEFELDKSTSRLRHRPALPGHPFDSSGHCWLYEELEMLVPGVFQIEILLSDGRILRFRFKNVTIWEFANRGKAVRNGASIQGSETRPKLTLTKLKELVFSPSFKALEPHNRRTKKKANSTAGTIKKALVLKSPK